MNSPFMETQAKTIFNQKKILITGGLGFIGSNLAHKLVDLGAYVTLIDSLIPEYGGNLFNIEGIEQKVNVNISDVRNEHSLHHQIQGQDYLFNLAGQTSHYDSMREPIADLENNAKAQLVILEACRKYNPDIKIVFASTRQIYGKPDYLPVDENHPLRPVDINGINKLAGEQYHLLYNDVYDIRTSVLRLTNTIGPRMRIKDARQTFAGIWIRQLLEGKPIEIWGGDQLRDFTFIDDAVNAFLLAASHKKAYGTIFNLGGNEVVSLKELAELLVNIHGSGEYRVREFPSERKKIDIGDYYSDFSFIKNQLGWKSKVILREGLKRTLSFYQKHWEHYL
jgi:nucleoside-diphosphate-sugar epimerase